MSLTRKGTKKTRHTLQTTNHRQTLQTAKWSTECEATNKYAALKKWTVQTIILNKILSVNLWYRSCGTPFKKEPHKSMFHSN